MNEYTRKKEISAEKIRATLGLRTLPEISFNIRELIHYDDKEGMRHFERIGLIRDEPPGYYSRFSEYIEVFRDDCPELSYYFDHHSAHRAYLIRLGIDYDGTLTPAAFNWVFTGRLLNGDRFCAVIYVMVMEQFRNCGLYSLLKLKEIDLAVSEGCDFIQTYHVAWNTNFNHAAIPNLKNGFLFYRGTDNGNCLYEDSGYIHFRKYLDPQRIQNVRVTFRDGRVLESPSQNQEIIRYLTGIREFPGKSIMKIGESS